MIGPLTVIVAGVLIAIAFGAGFAARRRQESRTRLLEVLARAVTRGHPLPPLVARLATELRGRTGRQADRFAERLSEGRGLADAFEGAAGLLPYRDVEAIRHAEDGPALAPVLEELARAAGRALTVRHRIGLALAYPALLIPLVALNWWRVGDLTSSLLPFDVPYFDEDFVLSALPFLGFAFLGTLGLLYRPGFSRHLSFISRAEAESRLYGLSAVHLETGKPLPTSLRLAAAGAGRRSVRVRAEQAADRIDAGESVQAIWPGFPAAGISLAARLRRQADTRRDRQRTKTERRFALVHPATVLVFAGVAFLQFRLLIEVFAFQMEDLPW